jgi:hypothetical protein
MRRDLDFYTGKTEPRFLPNTRQKIRDMPKHIYGFNPNPSEDEDKFVVNNNLLGK